MMKKRKRLIAMSMLKNFENEFTYDPNNEFDFDDNNGGGGYVNVDLLITALYDIEAVDISKKSLRDIRSNDSSLNNIMLKNNFRSFENMIRDKIINVYDKQYNQARFLDFDYIEGSSKFLRPREISPSKDCCSVTCKQDFILSLEVKRSEKFDIIQDIIQDIKKLAPKNTQFCDIYNDEKDYYATTFEYIIKFKPSLKN